MAAPRSQASIASTRAAFFAASSPESELVDPELAAQAPLTAARTKNPRHDKRDRPDCPRHHRLLRSKTPAPALPDPLFPAERGLRTRRPIQLGSMAEMQLGFLHRNGPGADSRPPFEDDWAIRLDGSLRFSTGLLRSAHDACPMPRRARPHQMEPARAWRRRQRPTSPPFAISRTRDRCLHPR